MVAFAAVGVRTVGSVAVELLVKTSEPRPRTGTPAPALSITALPPLLAFSKTGAVAPDWMVICELAAVLATKNESWSSPARTLSFALPALLESVKKNSPSIVAEPAVLLSWKFTLAGAVSVIVALPALDVLKNWIWGEPVRPGVAVITASPAVAAFWNFSISTLPAVVVFR